jgi:hypothetical protein
LAAPARALGGGPQNPKTPNYLNNYIIFGNN